MNHSTTIQIKKQKSEPWMPLCFHPFPNITTTLFSNTINKFWLLWTLNKWDWKVYITLSAFFHLTLFSNSLVFRVVDDSCYYLALHWMNIQFIHSTAEDHLGFQFCIIMLIWTILYMSFGTCLYAFLLGIHLGFKLLVVRVWDFQ